MKIISKCKDYYDYLQGVWGIDEKLVLDRTEYTPTPDYVVGFSPVISLLRFYICGMVVEGVYYQEKSYKQGIYLFGKDIYDVLKDRLAKEDVSMRKWRDTDRYYYIERTQRPEYGLTLFRVLKEPVDFFSLDHEPTWNRTDRKKIECPNDLLNCPILIENLPKDKEYDVSKCSKFPMLTDYNFHKVYSAHDIWLMLGEWLGREKTIPNNQTNSEKIQSNGFDLKTSFRHPTK